jgi:hypothetical protein
VALAHSEIGRPASVRPKAATAVNMDPNTHAYVLGTAFFTSLFFALAAWLPVGLLLRSILFG